MKFFLRVALCTAISTGCVLADMSYQSTIRFTGGTMVDMMHSMSTGIMGKMTGGRMGRALEDQNLTIYIKGDRMAHVGMDTSTIVDLNAGTITTVDNKRQTYSVMTFEEMHQQMEEMQKRMSRGKGSSSAPDVTFNVKVDDTGNTKTIDGQTAKQYIMTMTATGDQGAGMKVKANMWAVADEPGMAEMRDFYKRYAAKFAYAFAGAMNPMMGSASQGMAEVSKEAMKLNGYPVQQETSISGVQSPMGGGMMGRNENSDPDAPFIVSQQENHNFSAGPVDNSVFQVPAGFKEEKTRR